jgi:hypothetical protein
MTVDKPDPTESDAATTVSLSRDALSQDGASRPSTADDETSEMPIVRDAGSSDAEVPETQVPETEILDTEAPVTEAPETEAPDAEAPVAQGTDLADTPTAEGSDESESESESESETDNEAASDPAPSDAAAGSPGGHRADGLPGSVWQEPEEGRSRRSVLRVAAALGIAVASAVVLGLLIVVFSNAVGGASSKGGTTPPALTLPSGGGRAPASVTPADWVQQTTGSGIVFRAPPGWTERADSRIDYRVEPSAGGPGNSQVGVGLLTGSSDPDAAATNYATSTYSGQSRYVQQPATDAVSARGERGRQVVVDYSRSGTPVDVIIRAFPTPRGVLLVVSRASLADNQRAERLADATDASVRLP